MTRCVAAPVESATRPWGLSDRVHTVDIECRSPRPHHPRRRSGASVARLACRRHERMALPKVTPRTSPADHQLLARLAVGDEAAFDEIFRTWYAALVRFTERLIGDRARAEEVVQDVLLSLWQQRESLRGHGSAQAWLFHATRNRALNLLRHDRVTVRAEGGLLASSRFSRQERSSPVDDVLVEAEMHAAITAAMDALPPRCKRVFLLSRVHGLRHAQIGDQLGIGQKAVEAHITRAIRHLRVHLAPWLPVR